MQIEANRMKFSISRNDLLVPLSLVSGVLERRQTLPVLSNILVIVDGDQLSLTGTDSEIELIGRTTLDEVGVSGEVTIPARKFMDICKNLPDQANLNIQLSGEKLIIKVGRSRFTLATLPATDFPSVKEEEWQLSFLAPRTVLTEMLERTSMAMAQQDVRYYLNGMLLEIDKNTIKAIATDGHRLAFHQANGNLDTEDFKQIIIPRKGALELGRMMHAEKADNIQIVITANHIKAITNNSTFISKLVDGKFPDYKQVIPKNNSNIIIANKNELKQALSRVAILSNEKFRGVKLIFTENNLEICAHNQEQEEAEESIAVSYSGEKIEIGCNVSYLLDVFSIINNENIQLSIEDANSSILLEEENGSGNTLYVVMPMRL